MHQRINIEMHIEQKDGSKIVRRRQCSGPDLEYFEDQGYKQYPMTDQEKEAEFERQINAGQEAANILRQRVRRQTSQKMLVASFTRIPPKSEEPVKTHNSSYQEAPEPKITKRVLC